MTISLCSRHWWLLNKTMSQLNLQPSSLTFQEPHCITKLRENIQKNVKWIQNKKQMKLNEIKDKRKIKKKRRRIVASESSHSSAEMTSESEGEGDNWNQPLSETSEEDVQSFVLEKNDLKEEDFIIIYDNKYYPGQIKKINHKKKKTYLVLSMEQSGHNFRWPSEKEDSLWYSLEQIICKIGRPKPINARGSYHVSEM
ncbi:hypothetical protein QE152_g1295 [Popillia japonica]|uniref:Uncharacterized protein n=1 Tax=Popillia japonica TaxID=7064 RepID=A0AAW1N779_POPJA